MSDAALLAVLANGIIPADARDAGAAAVRAGPRLAERLAAGTNATAYRRGLDAAAELAQAMYRCAIPALNADQVQALLERLREAQPAFVKQLRLDVCALYLSDPGVWARIGFPGPSAEQGGYPDFDQPQR